MKPTSNSDNRLVDQTSLQQVLSAAYVVQQHNERLQTDQDQPRQTQGISSSLWEPQRKVENSAPDNDAESIAAGEGFNDPLDTVPSELEDIVDKISQEAFAEAPAKSSEVPLPSFAERLVSPSVPPVPASKLTCTACDHENLPGRRFCGFCGSPLNHPQAVEVTVPTGHAAEAFSVRGLDSIQAHNELQFLRDKSFGGEYYRSDSTSHRGRYVIAASAIILAGVTCMEWPFLRSQMPTFSQASPTIQLPVAGARAPQPAAPTPTEAQRSTSNEPQPQLVTPPKPLPVEHEEKASGKITDAGHPTQPADPLTLVSHTEAVGVALDATQELLLAQRYLDGRGVEHDSRQAAALLWEAVRKQNTRADILLAELYLLGDGVPKSCDQARFLLVAAAKNGSFQAAKELRNLKSSGCQ